MQLVRNIKQQSSLRPALLFAVHAQALKRHSLGLCLAGSSLLRLFVDLVLAGLSDKDPRGVQVLGH